jgi:hypothetical protein
MTHALLSEVTDEKRPALFLILILNMKVEAIVHDKVLKKNLSAVNMFL